MRMLLRVSIPVETGNAAAKAGTLGSTVERILADLKPEAAYFFADDNGHRSGSIVFDMKDFIANSCGRRAVSSRVQRKGLFPACDEPARLCHGRSGDCQGRSAIREVDTRIAEGCCLLAVKASNVPTKARRQNSGLSMRRSARLSPPSFVACSVEQEACSPPTPVTMHC